MTPMTPKLFSKTIEDIVKDKKANHMDAIVIFCEKNDVEPQDVKKFITKTIKDKVALNAQELHLIPKTNTLPI